MRVYLKSHIDSIGINRVEKALANYAPPWVRIVDDERDAELVILHVNGRIERNISRAKNLKEKSYAVIQYCLRSTQKPHTSDWKELWENASVVWSYYDLIHELNKDNVSCQFNFYHAPLGSDPNIFKPLNLSKEYTMCSVGLDYLTESIREVIYAVRNVNGKPVHLGSKLNIKDVPSFYGITDQEVAELYNKCYFVSGLRTKEGFELPAVEAILCGVKPVLFDTYNYRQWYNDFAIFIPEVDRETTIEALTEVLKDLDRSDITETDIEKAKMLFDWKRIINGFWERIYYAKNFRISIQKI